MSGLSKVDIKRMRDQLFFEGPERNRRLSWQTGPICAGACCWWWPVLPPWW